jgi:hypothetical protein
MPGAHARTTRVEIDMSFERGGNCQGCDNAGVASTVATSATASVMDFHMMNSIVDGGCARRAVGRASISGIAGLAELLGHVFVERVHELRGAPIVDDGKASIHPFDDASTQDEDFARARTRQRRADIDRQ